MGRVVESTMTDPVGGNVKTEQSYGFWNQVGATSLPRREGATRYWNNYGYSGVNYLSSIGLAEGGTVSYMYARNQATITNTDGRRRRYTYQSYQLSILESWTPNIHHFSNPCLSLCGGVAIAS
jgi:hypothetical protein